MKRSTALAIASIAFILTAALGLVTALGASVSFEGKTVSILIPYSVGGSADIMARQMVPFMEKHIPGNPTVIIKNMPGGGGIVGENWVYHSAPKDGTVIGQFSTAFNDVMFKPDKAKFDLAKLQWLGGVRETTVTFVSKDLGITSADQFSDLKQRVFIGVNSIQSPRGMLPRLFMRLLEVDHKVVTGYGSSGDMRAAMQRGELNMTNDSQSGYFAAVLPLVEQGVVVPIAQEGTVRDGKIVRDPRLPDVPTYMEILAKLKGDAVKQTTEFRAMELLILMGGIRRGWVYAPGVPRDVFDTMATALDRFLKDPEMLAHFKKAIGFELEALNASQAQAIADSVVEIIKKDPEAVALLKKLAVRS